MNFLIWERVKDCLHYLKMNMRKITRYILIFFGILLLLLVAGGWIWYAYEMMQDHISEKKFILLTASCLSIFLLAGVGLVVHRIYWHNSYTASANEKSSEMMKLCISLAVAFICCGAAVSFGTQVLQSFEINSKLIRINDIEESVEDLYQGSLSTLAEVYHKDEYRKVYSFSRELQSIYHGLKYYKANYAMYDRTHPLVFYLRDVTPQNFRKIDPHNSRRIAKDHKAFVHKYKHLIMNHPHYQIFLETEPQFDTIMKKYEERIDSIINLKTNQYEN